MIKVYDLNMRWQAQLENAFAVGYETPFNNVWTAHFSLPADDPKNAECKDLYFVEIFDGDERVDLFRIIPSDLQRQNDGKTVTYQCEHVLATLMDDILFQYNQIGNLGVYTTAVLQFILSKQEVPRWQVGTVAFAHQFEYKFENDNLLGALFSVPKIFVEAYHWTWDTSTYPWTLNLVAPETTPSCRIRYGYNLKGIKRRKDPTNLCTRLYCLGYGEGINQLKIGEVNGGKDYLDADTQGLYGIVKRVFTDRRYEKAETLMAAGQALLEQLKNPRYTYEVDAAELYQLTQDSVDKFVEGAMVQITDDELGIDVVARVVNRNRGDILGAPGDVRIEISNRPLDIAGSIAALADRQRISEVYSQGATNWYANDFLDNADPTHPAVIRFFVPAETVRINKMTLSYEASQFRAYSKSLSLAAQSVGTTDDGGGTTQTTTSAASQTPTTSTVAQQVATSGGGHWFTESGYTSALGATDVLGDHSHGIPSGTVLQVQGGGTVTYVSDGNHRHNITLNHDHQVTIPAHAHTVTIPAHSHDVTIPAHHHAVTIPAHTHDIQYGIFLRDPAPQNVSVLVDGAPIPGLTGVTAVDIDIIPYLAKSSDGKINRGAWHEIKITPDDLGRVNANVVIQLFVQSRGGGNY